jgi:hypothetical protein
MSTEDPNRRDLLRDALPAIALASIATATATSAQAQPMTPYYVTPGLSLAFTAWVQIAALRQIGDIPGGQGRLVPITGGAFEGPRLRGIVLPGGADWQTVRPDGVTELRAHYGLETDDGAIIQVWNNVLARLETAAAAGAQPARFLRSHIRLEAPKGPHDWLNRSIFVGTLNAPADARAPVTIRCFELT